MIKRLHLNEALQKSTKPRATESVIQSEKSLNSRLGKKVVAGHFDKKVVKQLKQIALNTDQSVQATLTEALNDLFAKYGFKTIA